MNSATTQPCPLGPACREGGAHRPGTKIYQDHARRAAEQSGKPAGEGEASLGREPLRKYGTGDSIEMMPDGTAEVVISSEKFRVGKEMASLLSQTNNGPFGSRPTEVTPYRFAEDAVDEFADEGFNRVAAEMAGQAVVAEEYERRLNDFFGSSSGDIMECQSGSYACESETEAARHLIAKYNIQEESNTNYDGGYIELSGEFPDGKRSIYLEKNPLYPSTYDSNDDAIASFAAAIDHYNRANLYGSGADYQRDMVETQQVEFGNQWDEWMEDDPERAIEAFGDEFDAMCERLQDRSNEFFDDQRKILDALDARY